MQVETIHVHVGARGVAHAPEDGLVEARQAAPPTIPHGNTKMTADDHDRDASQGHDPGHTPHLATARTHRPTPQMLVLHHPRRRNRNRNRNLIP